MLYLFCNGKVKSKHLQDFLMNQMFTHRVNKSRQLWSFLCSSQTTKKKKFTGANRRRTLKRSDSVTSQEQKETKLALFFSKYKIKQLKYSTWNHLHFLYLIIWATALQIITYTRTTIVNFPPSCFEILHGFYCYFSFFLPLKQKKSAFLLIEFVCLVSVCPIIHLWKVLMSVSLLWRLLLNSKNHWVNR